MSRSKSVRRSEAGFTLIEALVAVVVLSFGLIAVTNLLLVAASSNAVANQGTAAATIAAREMERLKGLRFVDPCLDEGGALPNSRLDALAASSFAPTTVAGACVPGVYGTEESVSGVGRIRVVWQIEDLAPSRGADPLAPAGVKFITVRAEGSGGLTGPRSRAEYTTIRTENPDPSVVVP